MQRSISPESLSALVEAIYDCVLDPNGWEAVLDAVRAEFSFVSAALGATPLTAGLPAVQASQIRISVGMQTEAVTHAIANYDADFAAIWGGRDKMHAYPLDEPIISSQVTDPATWPQNAYFRAVREPREIFDGVVVCVARDETMVAHLGFGAHRTLGRLEDSHVADLRLISPHIRRAVTISRLFDLKAVEASAFASTIDALAMGVIIVDDTGVAVHSNAAASTIVASGALGWKRGQLALDDPVAQAALELAIRQASQDEGQLGHHGIAVPMLGRDGSRHVIHVLPLRNGDLRRSLMRRAAAALFIAPARGTGLPVDALSLMYRLTPTEARIFELVYKGLTQADIGEAIGIAPSTVKTHMLRIFEKTGCRRQADLVRLGAEFSLPV